ARRAGHRGHPVLGHRLARLELVAHQSNAVGTGADEGQAVFGARLGQGRRLGQEAVAGVDRVGAAAERRGDQRRNFQVAVGGARRPNANGAVGEPRGEAVAVRLGHGNHGLQPEGAAGADDANRDLAAVRDEHAGHAHAGRASPAASGRMRISGCPYSTNWASWARISTTTPRTPETILVKTFIASTSPSVASASTVAPTSVNGGAPGSGAR